MTQYAQIPLTVRADSGFEALFVDRAVEVVGEVFEPEPEDTNSNSDDSREALDTAAADIIFTVY